jgi:predicted lipoprotein with Yx(FWY)xxD motif
MRYAIYGSAAVALLAMALTGCGNSTSPTGSSTSAPASTSAASGSGAVLKTGHTSLGTVLVNGSGYTVYWFAKDHGTASACTGACASAWPPVIGTPQAASGVSLPGKLAAISRGGGLLQATYNGHPLYTYAGDSAPGQAGGNDINGFGGLWYAITIGGSSTSPTPSAAASSTSYGY